MTMDDAQTLLTDLSLSLIILKNGIHEEKKSDICSKRSFVHV